ncbi:MAG TPA: hypothetical protein VJP80_03100 [Candidatus Saccharimonadales bacterium]|nr:hypothetical protein [Candidatus Saccharimonadales bacterium]
MATGKAKYYFFELRGGDYTSDLLQIENAHRRALLATLGNLTVHIAERVQKSPDLPDPVGVFSSVYHGDLAIGSPILQADHSWFAPERPPELQRAPVSVTTNHLIAPTQLLDHGSGELGPDTFRLVNIDAQEALAQFSVALRREGVEEHYLLGRFALGVDNNVLTM